MSMNALKVEGFVRSLCEYFASHFASSRWSSLVKGFLLGLGQIDALNGWNDRVGTTGD